MYILGTTDIWKSNLVMVAGKTTMFIIGIHMIKAEIFSSLYVKQEQW